jgi:hypothetical protein
MTVRALTENGLPQTVPNSKLVPENRTRGTFDAFLISSRMSWGTFSGTTISWAVRAFRAFLA